MRALDSERILLIDDTWVSGGHVQSAAGTLKDAGASMVGVVVLGRHVDPHWEPVRGSGVTCGGLLDSLPKKFDWSRCAVCA